MHDYEEKYYNSIKTTREKAEKAYEIWQESIRLPGWARTFIWIIFLSIISLIYFLKKKKKYCFRRLETEE